MTTPARIIFAGTPGFALETLKALHGAGHRIEAVITRPDRPAGRGRTTAASPVKQWAQRNGLELLQPLRWQDDALLRRLRGIGADLMVVAAYGVILPASSLDLCRLGAINIHASLLPRWRGAAPVAAAIRAGDGATGVTLMRMAPGLDTGPLLAQAETAILASETAGELQSRLAGLGAGLLLRELPGILTESLKAVPQQEALASYAPRIEKSQARLDWSLPAQDLARLLRAYDPWPVAHARWRGQRIRFWGGRAVEACAASPGKVLGIGNEGMDVACGDGALRVKEVQLPGRRRMAAAAAARGAPLDGALLE